MAEESAPQQKTTRTLVSGFTLIETFVAITILVAAIAGPMSIAAQGLFSSLLSGDQITASFLAQDSVEYVRWVRDTNRLSGNGWLAYLQPCASADGSTTCSFDTRYSFSGINADTGQNNVASCSGTCPVLSYDSASGFYNYASPSSSNAPSKFTRTISLKTPVNGNSGEASLTVRIDWLEHSAPHVITVSEELFNWQ